MFGIVKHHRQTWSTVSLNVVVVVLNYYISQLYIFYIIFQLFFTPSFSFTVLTLNILSLL